MATSDKITAARSANRDTSGAPPGPKQNCSDIVNISIFFDGTGNNRKVDGDEVQKDEEGKDIKPLNRWSNPARLWRAAQFLSGADSANYAVYIPGVGTPFGEEKVSWCDETLKSVQDGDIAGMGAGAGGTRRLDLGYVQVNNQLRVALSNSATKLNLSLASYVEEGKPANIKELAKALQNHGLVTIINLSIFGFSRGAALARAFSNEMMKKTTLGPDGVRRYNGMPIRFNFMGLFDTVASFGLPAKNIDTPFCEKNLVVPHAIERCVHYIAANELRFSFPVDLIRKNGKLQPNWTETVYPGAHSDVGGGYEPDVQKISNNYARIPMRHMMREAVRSGVRLLDYDDIEKKYKTVFVDRFMIKPDTLTAYQKYIGEIGVQPTVEAAVTAHMKALYSAWGTMTRRKIPTPDLVETETRDGSMFKHVGHPGIALEAKMHLAANAVEDRMRDKGPINIVPVVRTVMGKKYTIMVRPADWRLEAWLATASDGVLDFIRNSVHDSKAGFIHSLEPYSYFAARGMAESSRNVLAVGLDWLADAATAAKNGVIKVYHRAEGVVVETWEAGKLVATRTYRVGEKFVVDTVKAGVTYTVEVYQSTKEVVISTMKRGQQMVITTIDTTKKHISDAADATQKKATEVADATQKKATEIADATQKKATEIADATQRKATEVVNATQKKVGEIAEATQRTAREVGTQVYNGGAKVANGVGQAVDTGMQAVEEGWDSVRSALGY